MRFEQMQYLEAALRTGSFRQAAKELGVSQPTITTQVQRLEEDLGVVLVIRGAKGVRPTYAGERILPHAIAAIQAQHMLRQEASAIDSLKVGKVRIASVSSGSQTVLPGVMKRLHDEYPSISFEITEAGSDMVRYGVLSGHFDVGLLVRSGIDDDTEEQLHFIDLRQGRVVLSVPEAHPVAHRETFAAEDLRNEPIIMYKQGSVLQRALERLTAGVEIRVVCTTDSAETAQSLVRAGVGIAIANTLAPSTVSGDGAVLVPLPYSWTRATLSVAVREGQLRSPVVQTMLRLARGTSSAARPSSTVTRASSTVTRAERRRPRTPSTQARTDPGRPRG